MNDAENRKLAEWLEPSPHYKGPDYKCWQWVESMMEWRVKVDFRTDEAANAMLLEKMPEDYACVFRDDVHGGWYVGQSMETKVFDKDRKTAIVLAALKLIEQGAK